MNRRILSALVTACGATLAMSTAAWSQTTVDIHAVSAEGIGDQLGTVTLSDSDNGLVLEVEISGLSPGGHGFHLHENPSCEPAENSEGQMTAALGAGGHYDPEGTGKHLGPSGDGHLGDLPVIYVMVDEEEGALPVRRVLVAPRLDVDETSGHALVIHENGDNYRDEPAPLGGGGSRVACGVID